MSISLLDKKNPALPAPMSTKRSSYVLLVAGRLALAFLALAIAFVVLIKLTAGLAALLVGSVLFALLVRADNHSHSLNVASLIGAAFKSLAAVAAFSLVNTLLDASPVTVSLLFIGGSALLIRGGKPV